MQKFRKTKHTSRIHKKPVSRELLSHFIKFMKEKYNI